MIAEQLQQHYLGHYRTGQLPQQHPISLKWLAALHPYPDQGIRTGK